MRLGSILFPVFFIGLTSPAFAEKEVEHANHATVNKAETKKENAKKSKKEPKAEENPENQGSTEKMIMINPCNNAHPPSWCN